MGDYIEETPGTLAHRRVKGRDAGSTAGFPLSQFQSEWKLSLNKMHFSPSSLQPQQLKTQQVYGGKYCSKVGMEGS